MEEEQRKGMHIIIFTRALGGRGHGRMHKGKDGKSDLLLLLYTFFPYLSIFFQLVNETFGEMPLKNMI